MRAARIIIQRVSSVDHQPQNPLKWYARSVDIFEQVFDHGEMTAAADLTFERGNPDTFSDTVNADPTGDTTEHFDDTDGAYATAEPDPFADYDGRTEKLSALVRSYGGLTHRRPSLRAELGTVPARPIAGLARALLPPLPVPPGLEDILPDGLRRGSTIAVTSSISLLLAMLGASSASGAWTALVGMPAISAEAVDEAGIDLGRLAIISPPEKGWTPAAWTTAVGALLDAVDVVVARPGALLSTATLNTPSPNTVISDGDARRLTARARSKDAVLLLFGQLATAWPAVEMRLSAQHGRWAGIGDGYGRIRARQLTVSVTGKGRSARPRKTELWLPLDAAATKTVAATATGPELTPLSEAG
jgi:hypothetical protein